MAGRENSDDPTTDKIHKCKVCKIKCPDIQSYVEHLESKDHKKGIMKEKYGDKYLEAKAKLENTPKTHMNVPEDKPMIPKDNPKQKLEKESSSGSSEENDVYTCEVCQKVCTGFLNYQLHLEGQKHQKNLKKAKLLKYMKETNQIPKPSEENPPEQQSLLDRITTNSVCLFGHGVQNLPEEMLRSRGVQAALQKRRPSEEAGDAKFAGGDEIGTHRKASPVHEDNSPFVHCDVCQKNFSGLLPYQQHIESITHLKQTRHVEQLSKIKDLIINSEEDSKKFQCQECGKTFSSPVPFNAHLKSFAHETLKKKSAQMEDLQKKHPEMVKILKQQDDSDSNGEEEGALLGCDVCHLACSGPEAARDHFASAKHKNAMKKKFQFQKYMKQQKGIIVTEASGAQHKYKTAKHFQKIDSSDCDSEFDIIQEV